ncbi:MAG: hypothetical protein FWC41_07360, partial [Firmicutes bacterium]|nr:hypothetical protein [Bacillota bacterium]
SYLSVDAILNGIRSGIVTFKELQETGEFTREKQNQVNSKLDGYAAEDNAFNSARTLYQLREFKRNYPNSEHIEEVNAKIVQKEHEEREEQRRKYEEIRRNINEYTPDELKSELGEEFLRNLCYDLRIDYDIVNNYDEPYLSFNDIPQNPDDVPSGFTDVFFWGIPSSGKTCALSAILSTIKSKYTMTNPIIETKFGATYRDSLVNIFRNETGYLPAATQKDRTQYMPFLLKKRNEKYYRQVSFFELSGEVFKYFYEITNNSRILSESDRDDVEMAFSTLNLLLNSKNQKIHFFFIDYKQETKGTKDRNNLTQENYLDAAATYFRDRNDIFKKRTDAVYVVVTKSDEIKVDKNKSPEEQTKERNKVAIEFLDKNFGGFMDVIKHRCSKDSVNFAVKMFSIGDVYFKKICKINHRYAEHIVEDLIDTVKPFKEDSWFTKKLKS